MGLKIILIFAILLSSSSISHGQLYFPDDNGGYTQLLSSDPVQIPQNLTQLRGSETYEKTVNSVISTGLLKLTLAVNKAIRNSNQQVAGNIVYAPISIGGALALVLLGSNGKTFQEIISILGLTSGIDVQTKSQQIHEQFGRIIKEIEAASGFQIGSQVNFASAIFVQDEFPIRNLYKENAKNLYQSEILNVNFKDDAKKAQEVINEWVAKKTKDKIRNLLAEPPEVTTRVIIASAMYFKALWKMPFYDGATKKRPFYPNGRKSPDHVLADIMYNGGDFPYFKDPILKCEVMGFPYKGGQSVMYVVIPDDSNMEKLIQLEQTLTPTELERLVNNVQPTSSIVVFPKMTIDSTVDLKAALEALGVKSLFSPQDANLALLSPGNRKKNPRKNPKLPGGGSAINPIESRLSELRNFPNAPPPIMASRMNKNCSEIFNANSTLQTCEENVIAENSTKRIEYKRIGNKVGRRLVRKIDSEQIQNLDALRQLINQQPSPESFENPHLYADKVIHKVYMDITESGTEAAAATATSLSKSGGKVIFKADVPFLFFIRHEQTKTILFWGTVTLPTPNYPAEEKH